MSATIIQFRDYKSPEERQIEIDRLCLAAVNEALAQPDTSPCEFVAPDGDCA